MILINIKGNSGEGACLLVGLFIYVVCVCLFVYCDLSIVRL